MSAAVRPRRITSRLAPLAFFLALLALYLPALGVPPPTHDELHHLLAARALLDSGTPRIAEGVYPRALLFSWQVAASFALFGESLFAARLPAALAIALTATLLFLWLRREVDVRTALLAAGLFALSPFAVKLAHLSRFYGSQLLFVLLGAIAVHAATAPQIGWRRRLLLLLGAALAFALARHFQATSLLAALGALLWCGLWLLWRALARGRLTPARLLALALAALPLLALLLWFAHARLLAVWQNYRWTPLFNRATQDAFWFYHVWYLTYYPTLWTLTPVLLIPALLRRSRLALFCALIFALGFLLNSLAGPKKLRYFAYAQPFLFALWGLALAALWPAIRDRLAAWRAQLGACAAAQPLLERPARLLPAAAVLAVVIVNPWWLHSAAMLAGLRLPIEEVPTRWSLAAPRLRPLLREAGVVVSSFDLEPLYYLGRYDILYNLTRQSELPPGERRDFGIDPRTGRAVIGSVAALARIVACHEDGIFLSDRRHWRLSHQVDDAAKAWVEAHLEPVPLPAASRVLAFRWRHEVDPSDPACVALRRRWQPPPARAYPSEAEPAAGEVEDGASRGGRGARRG